MRATLIAVLFATACTDPGLEPVGDHDSTVEADTGAVVVDTEDTGPECAGDAPSDRRDVLYCDEAAVGSGYGRAWRVDAPDTCEGAAGVVEVEVYEGHTAEVEVTTCGTAGAWAVGVDACMTGERMDLPPGSWVLAVGGAGSTALLVVCR